MIGGSADVEPLFGDRLAVLPLAPSGRIEIDRRAARAVLTVPDGIPAPALAHPYLGPVGAVFALWAGREVLHAGAFVGVDGGVWGLLGGREAGKSSTLASLHAAGVTVVCDDVLVVDGSTACAGPRCVDLRRPTAERLGIGRLLAMPGDRQRWRVGLPPVDAELPLNGWILLEWGASVQLTAVPLAQRLGRLAAHRSLGVRPVRPATMLELAVLPMWTLARPREWGSMGAVLDVLSRLGA